MNGPVPTPPRQAPQGDVTATDIHPPLPPATKMPFLHTTSFPVGGWSHPQVSMFSKPALLIPCVF